MTSALLPEDPRARLAMALVLAFGFAAVERAQTVPMLLTTAALIAIAAGTPTRTLRKLRGPLVLAAAFLVVMPLVAGPTTLWRAGPLRLRAEGLEAGLLLAGRLLAIVTVTLALLSTLPPHRLAAALRGLGAPALVADLMLLTLRYATEFREEMLRARLARRLRGGRRGWRDVGGHAATLAAALIRGQRRAEAVWTAMRLRGHASTLVAPTSALRPRDVGGVACAVGLALAAVALDRLA
ncbi:MAG: cobalt ECF transporter T component CbiQ [Rhodobacteraceae bacterium]|nr:MAG: cobalt ECF transporter T component CbiQ [Paracoccaceae bacterium]